MSGKKETPFDVAEAMKKVRLEARPIRLQQVIDMQAAEITRLTAELAEAEKAPNMALGYMRLALVELATKAPKGAALETISRGLELLTPRQAEVIERVKP